MKKHILKNIWLLALVIGAASCNHDFDNRLEPKTGNDSSGLVYRSPKVLYVIVDGARGTSTQAVNPPRLMEMSEHALYTWNAVADTIALPVTAWADMLTGVYKEKHQVTKADFSGNQLAAWPMFFQRLKKDQPALRTAAFCAAAAFKDNLVSAADVKESYNDDASVKNAALKELERDSAAVVLTQFGGVDAAGKQYGYDASVSAYRSAILQVDSYIGELVDKLKARPNYSRENWLVIVASNMGGYFTVPPAEDDKTVFSDPRLNQFVMIYHPRFAPSYVARPNTSSIPYTGYAVTLQGKDAAAINATLPAASATAYNFNDKGDYTVQCKIKILGKGSPQPAFLAKYANTTGAQPGWAFMFQSAGEWRVIVGATGKALAYLPGKNLPLNEWHTLTFKLYTEGAKRYGVVFTDDTKHTPTDLTGYNITNAADLTVGFSPGWVSTGSSQTITDIRIYNVALDDATIQQDAKATVPDFKKAYNINNLIGYWPCTEGIGGVFKDMSPSKKDLKINGAFKWNSFSDLSAYMRPPLPPNVVQTMPGGIDLPYTIFNWMKAPGYASWGLDGRTRVTGFMDVQP